MGYSALGHPQLSGGDSYYCTIKTISTGFIALISSIIIPHMNSPYKTSIDEQLILYKYYIPCAGDSRKYHPEECDYQPRRSRG